MCRIIRTSHTTISLSTGMHVTLTIRRTRVPVPLVLLLSLAISASPLPAQTPPSGVAIAPKGDIWVADGHRGGNNRIVRLSADGTFIRAIGGGIGTESREPGRFSDPHDILYAGDGLSGDLRTGPPDPWRSNFGWEKGGGRR